MEFARFKPYDEDMERVMTKDLLFLKFPIEELAKYAPLGIRAMVMQNKIPPFPEDYMAYFKCCPTDRILEIMTSVVYIALNAKEETVRTKYLKMYNDFKEVHTRK